MDMPEYREFKHEFTKVFLVNNHRSNTFRILARS